MSDFDFESRQEQLSHAKAVYDNTRELTTLITDALLLSIVTLNGLKDMQRSIGERLSVYEILIFSLEQEEEDNSGRLESIDSIKRVVEDWQVRLKGLGQQIKLQETIIESGQVNLKVVTSQQADAKRDLLMLLRGFTGDFRNHLDSS